MAILRKRNPFVQLGRPPKPKILTAPRHVSTGEKQGLAPMDGFRTGIPASAFNCGGAVKTMPKFHDDPAFCKGGKIR